MHQTPVYLSAGTGFGKLPHYSDTVTTTGQGVFAKDISTSGLKVFCSKTTACQ